VGGGTAGFFDQKNENFFSGQEFFFCHEKSSADGVARRDNVHHFAHLPLLHKIPKKYALVLEFAIHVALTRIIGNCVFPNAHHK
jgi:hypothetical protein